MDAAKCGVVSGGRELDDDDIRSNGKMIPYKRRTLAFKPLGDNTTAITKSLWPLNVSCSVPIARS